MKSYSGTPRSFGLLVGGAFCVLAALLFWRQHVTASIALGTTGAVLLLTGLAYPALLERPSALWWRFSHALAAVNARILLTVLFFVALVPMAIVWRLIGKDPLSRSRRDYRGWAPYPSRYRDHRHYERMY